MFVTLSPCLACSRIIFSTGIKEVTYLKSYADYKGLDSDEGVDFLEKFGVKTTKYTGELTNVTHMI
ncbi:MAG: dCMP deaminase [Bacteroidia bacterium]